MTSTGTETTNLNTERGERLAELFRRVMTQSSGTMSPQYWANSNTDSLGYPPNMEVAYDAATHTYYYTGRR